LECHWNKNFMIGSKIFQDFFLILRGWSFIFRRCLESSMFPGAQETCTKSGETKEGLAEMAHCHKIRKLGWNSFIQHTLW
jgi:hypothetical protein